jgi:hypothetical protein
MGETAAASQAPQEECFTLNGGHSKAAFLKAL